MMKILFTLGWTGKKDRLNYLPTFELVSGIHAQGQDVSLLVTDDVELPEPALRSGCDKWIKQVPHDYRTTFGFSRNMAEYLKEHNDFDIYHTNGLRNHLNHQTCVAARRQHRPYLITPYGMLNDYQPENRQSLARRIYHRIFFSNDIRYASCLRAISLEEAKQFRALGLDNPIAYIPWPNSVPPFLDEAIAKGRQWKNEHPHGRRIASIIVDMENKPLKTVIDAFIAVAEENDELLLLDFGYVASTDKVKQLLNERQLKNVRVVDYSSDFDNTVLLASCSATVIPAHHMFLGPVLARTLLCLTPAICVHNPEWEEVPDMECGWWCPPGQHAMERLISAALLMNDDLLEKKGLKGRDIILREYATDVVAAKMIRLYRWILGDGPKPEYVI